MKKLLEIFVCLIVIWVVINPHFVRAESDTDIQAKISQVEAQRDALLQEQQKLQTALDETAKEGQSLKTNVKTLDATRAKLANDLKITQTNISSANLNIQKLENSISQNQNQIEDSKIAIQNSLQKLDDYDKHSIALDVLSSGSLTDIWNDSVNLWDIQDNLQNAIEALKNNQTKLLQNKVAKESQKTNLVSLSSQLQGQKQVADATRSAQALLLAATQDKEAKYQQMLAENRAQELVFENQLFQFESQLKASNPTLTPAAGHGALSWPLDNIFVTQQFGKTSSSGRLYASGTHNGTDFRATVGTPVKAAQDGVVAGMGNTDEEKGCYSYGRWLLIKYNNGLSSLYGHLSGIIVSNGDGVTDGQVVGYSGGQPGQFGSGYSTGPHLHMTLFASAAVQILPYTTSINCKGVSIPLANPQDYLDPMAYLPSLE